MKGLFGILSLLLVVSGIAWFYFGTFDTGKEGDDPGVIGGFRALDIKRRMVDPDLAAAKAKEAYRTKEMEGTDFSSGPCISEDLIPGWVADVAHSPREPIDDLPGNQCAAFREGRADHFVELDLRGNVIQVY